MEEPVFFFELRPDGGEYGLGCYDMKSASMEHMRGIIDGNPYRVDTLVEGALKGDRFVLYGEDYKRPKGNFDSAAGMLYNKKKFGFTRTMKWGRELTDKRLPEHIARNFEILIPMFNFMLEFACPPEE